jgi:hypothetical protein
MQDASLVSAHNMIMAFMLQLARSLPHGENATSHTGLLCPVKVLTLHSEPSRCTRHS